MGSAAPNTPFRNGHRYNSRSVHVADNDAGEEEDEYEDFPGEDDRDHGDEGHDYEAYYVGDGAGQDEDGDAGQEGEDIEDSPPAYDGGAEEEDTEELNDLQDAFTAGWRAKQTTAAMRLKRGYVAPRPREKSGEKHKEKVGTANAYNKGQDARESCKSMC